MKIPSLEINLRVLLLGIILFRERGRIHSQEAETIHLRKKERTHFQGRETPLTETIPFDAMAHLLVKITHLREEEVHPASPTSGEADLSQNARKSSLGKKKSTVGSLSIRR